MGFFLRMDARPGEPLVGPGYHYCAGKHRLPGDCVLLTVSLEVFPDPLPGRPALLGGFLTLLLGPSGPDGRPCLSVYDWPTARRARAGHTELVARLRPH
jgi:hypothetical protein